MAAYTELHDGVKYARVLLPGATSTIGTTHLAKYSFYRYGPAVCGLIPPDVFIALDAGWQGEAPNPCKSCAKLIQR